MVYNMEKNVQRIGVGNSKYPSVGENEIKEPTVLFEFSTNELTFDQMDRTFDEDPELI